MQFTQVIDLFLSEKQISERRNRFFICWFTPQTAERAMAELIRGQQLHFGSPMLVHGLRQSAAFEAISREQDWK